MKQQTKKLYPILLLCMLGLMLSSAKAASAGSPTFVGAGLLDCGQSCNNCATDTYSYTVPSATTNALVLVKFTSGSSVETVTGATFDGTAMTYFATVSNGSPSTTSYVYYLPEAPQLLPVFIGPELPVGI